ncbi:MAG: SRPBCC family protein [Stellaceae bacterium]
MPEPAGDNGPQRLEPMRLSRVFAARRETVFAAWSTTDHVRRWFCPETFSIPDASVEMRVGGRFDLCMRSPAGEEHWVHGRFTEVLPHRRLAIEMQITDGAGTPLFKTLTEVDFSDATGTRMDVVQTYTMIDPAKTWMVAGAPEGWRSTLDKLEREVARIEGAGKPA